MELEKTPALNYVWSVNFMGLELLLNLLTK